MSLSLPVKAGVSVLGGAALLGWGTTAYLWNQPSDHQQELTVPIIEADRDTGLMQSAGESLEQLKGRISDAEADLDSRMSVLEERKQQIAEAENHLAKMKSDIEASQGEFQEITAEIDQGNATIDQYKKSLAKLGQDQNLLEASLAKSKAELDDVTKELETSRVAIQEADAEGQDSSWNPLSIDPVMATVPVQTPMGLRISLVHFDRGSADVSPGGQRKAKEVADWITSEGVESIQIVGFADTVGSQAENKELSERRAQSIAALLEHAGISPTKLEVISHGEDRLPELTEDQMSEPLNRCVGIFIAPEPDHLLDLLSIGFGSDEDV